MATPARAEVSSWSSVGGGASWLSAHGSGYKLKPTMQLDMGVGSSPSKPAIVGGILRTTTYFGEGTDLTLAAREATRGFVTGDWGLALDAGGYARWWGDNSFGPTGTLHLGMPFGFTLSVQGAVGSNDQRVFGAMFGIDLLRLTVYRLGGENLWVNPRPAWRPDER